MRSEKFGSELYRKSNIWFFTFLNVYVSWIKRDKILISQLSPPIFRYFVTRMDQRQEPMKIKFENFQIQKRLSQTLWSLLWSLNCPKYCIFGKFVLTLARNLNLLKQSLYIHLNGLAVFFQKLVCFIGLWTIVPKRCWLNRSLTKRFINFKR